MSRGLDLAEGSLLEGSVMPRILLGSWPRMDQGRGWSRGEKTQRLEVFRVCPKARNKTQWVRCVNSYGRRVVRASKTKEKLDLG